MAAKQRPLDEQSVRFLASQYSMHFDTMQSLVQVIEGRHGIYPIDTLPVRDGIVERGQQVWWRSENGPEQSTADDRGGVWANIAQEPQLYSLAKPKFKYED